MTFAAPLPDPRAEIEQRIQSVRKKLTTRPPSQHLKRKLCEELSKTAMAFRAPTVEERDPSEETHPPDYADE